MNRVLTFVSKNYDGLIPDDEGEGGPLSPNDKDDAEFINDVNGLLHQYIDALESVKLRLGLQIVMQISSRGNGYLQASGLNTALKTSDPKRCTQVLVRAVNLIYILSVLVEPYMPSTAEAILLQLNAPKRSVPDVFNIDILPGHHIGKPAHLFKPIDEKMAEVWKAKFAGSSAAKMVGDVDADTTHVTAPISKRQAAAAAKKLAADMAAKPKTPEIIQLEGKIAAVGNKVRELKAKASKTAELEQEILDAVAELKRLKSDLTAKLESS